MVTLLATGNDEPVTLSGDKVSHPAAPVVNKADHASSPLGRGFLVFLLYSMRRVDCRRCDAVVVEEVPWGDGKRTLARAYMLFLARWARRLSWKETAEAFRTSWEKVFDAVEHVVTFGLEHRVLGQIDAIGVDEIQYRPLATTHGGPYPG